MDDAFFPQNPALTRISLPQNLYQKTAFPKDTNRLFYDSQYKVQADHTPPELIRLYQTDQKQADLTYQYGV